MDYSYELTGAEKLRFVVFGVGAIGTYIGGSLLVSGQPVVFVERDETARQVQSKGLHLQIGEENHHILNPTIYTNLETALQAGQYDVAVVAVKSYDTLELAQTISRLSPNFSVLSLQNGVENELLLATHFGQDHVIAGSLTSAVRRNSPGDITLERLRGVAIASDNPLAEAISVAFNRAGLKAHLYENAQSMKWSKLLTNLLANASSAILDMPPAEIFANRDLYALEVNQVREALNVMRGLDLPVTDLPGTPVRMLAFLLQSLPLKISQPIAKRALGRGRGGKMPSFHIDLHAGRAKSEVDYLNGAVVRFARQLGLAAPVNKVLNDTLLALVGGKFQIQDFARRPDKLLGLVGAFD